MGEVVKFKRPGPKEEHKGKTLCRSGFHKWEVIKERQFDVKKGKLVTLLKCKRCGLNETKLT